MFSQQEPKGALWNDKSNAQEHSSTAAGDEIGKVDTAAAVSGNQFIAQGSIGIVAADKQCRQDRIQDWAKNGAGEQSEIHHPSSSLPVDVNGVDNRHQNAEKYRQG